MNTIHAQLNSEEPSEVISQECKKKIRQTLSEQIGQDKAEELVSNS